VSNLIHLQNKALNTALAVEPGYARIFFSAIAPRFGINRIIDGTTGEVITSDNFSKVADSYTPKSEASLTGAKPNMNWQPYRIVNGIAVLDIQGSLTHKLGSINPYSGMIGYDGILYQLEHAIKNEDVKGVLMDNDTPGGMVSGCFDAADRIAKLRNEKPIWAIANDMNCSAGQMLASACSRRLITQTGVAGSIGVLMAHANISKQAEMSGVEITLVHAGSHKVDGNPYEKLPQSVREKWEVEAEDLRLKFATKAASYMGIESQVLLDTEAQVYTGEEAVEAGLADEVVNNNDAISMMADHINSKKTQVTITMSDQDKKKTASAAKKAEQAEENNVDSQNDTTSGEPETKPTASADEGVMKEAADTERARVMGILALDEAEGRSALAHKLANMPSMSVEQAKELLAVAPIEQVGAKATAETLADEHGKPLESSVSEEESDDEAKVSLLVRNAPKR